MNYMDDNASSGSGDDGQLDGHKPQSVTPSGSGKRKRSRKATGEVLVDAMLEIAAASKMRASAMLKNEDQYSISKGIKVLDDEMQGVELIYFLALDLFENPDERDIHLSQE